MTSDPVAARLLVVILPLAVLSSLLLVDLDMPPGPFPHHDAIFTLAEVEAIALVASKNCPDLFVNTDLDQMQAALGLSNADTPEAFDLTVKLIAEFSGQIEKSGAQAWCSDAYARFGPDGTMMKGLLKRCDPHSSSC